MSKKFLLVTTSSNPDSHSAAWGRRVLSTYGALSGGEDADVIVHDLAQIQPQQLTHAMIQVLTGKVEYDEADKQTKARLDIQQELIRDLQSVDHLIVTTPVWHHFAPSYLVAWIQMVTKINPLLEQGITRYYKNLNRLQSALLIMTTTVACYRDGAVKDYDFLPRYMKTILNQVGVDDMTTIWHQGIDNLLVDTEQESTHTERIIQQRVSSIINTSTGSK